MTDQRSHGSAGGSRDPSGMPRSGAGLPAKVAGSWPIPIRRWCSTPKAEPGASMTPVFRREVIGEVEGRDVERVTHQGEEPSSGGVQDTTSAVLGEPRVGRPEVARGQWLRVRSTIRSRWRSASTASASFSFPGESEA